MRENLHAVEYIYPLPGTDRPWAVLRLVDVLDEGRRVRVWRAVTYEQPRELIGYWLDLDVAVMRTHMKALTIIQQVPSIREVHADLHGMPPIGWDRNQVGGSES